MDPLSGQAPQLENGVVTGAPSSPQETESWSDHLREYWARRAEIAKNGGDNSSPESSHGELADPKFYGFTSLPLEIREMIYQYIVVKGTFFVPNICDGPFQATSCYIYDMGVTRGYYGNTYLRYQGVPDDWGASRAKERPIGLLLGVNHMIHQEAMRIFCSMNRFVLPYGEFGFCRTLSNRPILTSNLLHLRNVSCPFDMRDLEHACYRARYNEDSRPGENDNPRYPAVDQATFMRTVHDRMKRSLRSTWHAKLSYLMEAAVTTVQLDFEECYCPMGCCRMVGDVMAGLADIRRRLEDPYIMSYMRDPDVVEVMGWYDEAEETLIRDSVRLSLPSLGSDQVRFIGRSKKQVRAERRASGLRC